MTSVKRRSFVRGLSRSTLAVTPNNSLALIFPLFVIPFFFPVRFETPSQSYAKGHACPSPLGHPFQLRLFSLGFQPLFQLQTVWRSPGSVRGDSSSIIPGRPFRKRPDRPARFLPAPPFFFSRAPRVSTDSRLVSPWRSLRDPFSSDHNPSSRLSSVGPSPPDFPVPPTDRR